MSTFSKLQRELGACLKNDPDDTTFIFLLVLQQFADAITVQIKRGSPMNIMGYTVMLLLLKYNVITGKDYIKYIANLMASINGCYGILDYLDDDDATVILLDVGIKHNDRQGVEEYLKTRQSIATKVHWNPIFDTLN